MSSRGPVIAITVTSDATQATKEFKNVAEGAKDMGDTVDRAGRDVAGGFDKLTESADGGERRFRGMNDTIQGTQGLMSSLASGDIVGVIGGLTDLAGGIADFAGPALSSLAVKLGLTTAATEAQTEAQVAENVAMDANPIGLIVAALAALAVALYLAWTKSETFRDIVTGAFDAVKNFATDAFDWIKDNWPLLLGIITGPIGLAVVLVIQHWDEIKNKASEVKDWIHDRVDDIAGFFTGLPGRLAALPGQLLDIGKDMGSKLVDGAKQGLSDLGSEILGAGGAAADFARQIGGAIIGFVNTQVIDRINRSLEITIPGPGFLPDIHLDPPDIPHLAAGGRVRARPGGVLALLAEAGQDEAVIPLGPGGGGLGGQVTIIQNFPAGVDPREVASAQRRYLKLNGVAP